VSKRLPTDVYADLTAAGLDPQAATTLTAIAGGESGYDTSALGDVGLQDAIWGPSVGLYQIRTLKSQTGTGGLRDIEWLAASPEHQAQAAAAISQQGTSFSPWSVYRTGKWRQFLATAQSAAAAAGNVITTADPVGPLPTFGPDWMPWNWPSNIGNAAIAQTLGGARSIVIEGLAVVLGLALVGAGLVVSLRPVTGPVTARMGEKRDQAAGAATTAAVAL
jgi:hypothetical protein